MQKKIIFLFDVFGFKKHHFIGVKNIYLRFTKRIDVLSLKSYVNKTFKK